MSPPSPSDASRADRDAAILADREAGVPWSRIALKYGVSVRTAHRAADRARGSQAGASGTSVVVATSTSLLEVDGLAELSKLVALHDSTIAAYSQIAAMAGQDHVRLGALTRRLEAGRSRFELLERLGLAPRAEVWQASAAMRGVLNAVQRALSDPRCDVPIEVIEELLAEAERHMPTHMLGPGASRAGENNGPEEGPAHG